MNDANNVSILAMRDTAPTPEAQITRDLVKRGLYVAPALFAVSWIVWGSDGAWSSAYALGVVLCNFMAAAGIVVLTVRISYALMMAATLFGYLLRLAAVAAAVMLVREAAWMNLVALGFTLVIAHLGLLFWEIRYVSVSLAYPGLRPTSKSSTTVSTDRNPKEDVNA